MIRQLGIAGRKKGLTDWWTAGSATCLCAYQAKGAASADAARLDLTGSGYDLTGATPTWSSAAGWTSFVGFDTISGLSLPTDISVIWGGTVLYSSTGNISMWNNSGGNWLGLAMHTYTGPDVYFGYGSVGPTTITVQQLVDNDTTCVFCFQKTGSTGNHKLFQNGTSKYDAVPANNAAASNVSARLYTGNNGCWGAALYDGILSSADITAISNYLNGL